MAEQLFFARHTKVYLVQGSNVWEIPVMDGFSFSQATNATEVTLAEMESTGGISRRGRQMFNDSYAPAEWSFSTYIRPFIADSATGEWEDTVDNHHAVEEPLWANFVSPFSSTNTWVPPAVSTSVWGAGTEGVTLSTSSLAFDLNSSNSSTLGTFELWFDLGSCAPGGVTQPYKITECVVNSVTVDFDIDGLATAQWSGLGAVLSEEVTLPTPTIVEGTGATSNFIRNRLTTLSVQAGDDAAQGGTGATFTTFPGAANDGVYNVVLTGGSINFENNITFLTPETLCTVNRPLGHVTGTRTIGGNFTAYLDTGAAGASGDLWDDLIAADAVVTNSFTLGFTVGGASAPKVLFSLSSCHIEVPTHSIEDVISLDVNFHALPSTIAGTDEASITYTGTAL